MNAGQDSSVARRGCGGAGLAAKLLTYADRHFVSFDSNRLTLGHLHTLWLVIINELPAARCRGRAGRAEGRAFKPRPTGFGVRIRIRIGNPEWWSFNVHKYGLYTAVILSLQGVALAFVLSRSFSGSIHATFGMLT